MSMNKISIKIEHINVIIPHIVIWQQQTGYDRTLQHSPGPPQQQVPQIVVYLIVSGSSSSLSLFFS